jgi:hypothetical protein
VPRRILYFGQGCYLDDSNGAAVATRALMKTLARLGFDAEVVSGMILDLDREVDPATWLAELGRTFEEQPGGGPADLPPSYSLEVDGVPVTLHRGTSTRLREPDDGERGALLRLFAAVLDRFRPDILVSYGGNRLANEARAHARSLGIANLFPLQGQDQRGHH